MLADRFDAVIGVDTHQDTHTAAVVATATGAVLDELTVTADPDGYDALVALADRHSGLRVWSVEGTGSYGAGLTAHLQGLGETVIEIERPNRPARRNGKSDAIDAVRGAREALSLEHHAQPRSRGPRAALAATLAARRSAVDASATAQRQLRALVLVAPEQLRSRFRGQSTTVMTATAASLRTSTRWDLETATSATALRALARRINTLNDEADTHEATLRSIVASWRPDLLELTGVGPIVAATILCAWSHPGRCRSDAAFANLAGAAPIEASSGKHTAHRLNRGGDRQLNRAIHVIALSRLRYDPRHTRLRRTPPTRAQHDRPQDPPLPQALHRPPALPTAREPALTHLTIHRSVPPAPRPTRPRVCACVPPAPGVCACVHPPPPRVCASTHLVGCPRHTPGDLARTWP